MFSRMQFFVVLAFILTIETYSALKLSTTSVTAYRKSNGIVNAQVLVAQAALSFALVLGIPAVSNGKK